MAVMIEVSERGGGKKLAAHSSGEVREFPNREAAKQFMRHRWFAWAGWRIVEEVTTPKRWRVK